ncbi:MAG: 30S ribosomal protein S4 [Candidatus Cloacimonetes bacterium]|jgi:small subunit ribosomal protein S4|nr:30S ribosomal protein S4 [Candidatus Cloacimonadota bacterium]MBT6993541.1 30S ribosomal protein S4 [Candidatus Cloacimonadota bacterium]
MARYTGPSCRLCRREGTKLFLKGARCSSAKCAMEKRPYIPGEHGNGKRFNKKMSDYGIHLREKQKVRRIYGILEKQFRKYFKMAAKKTGVTGENLLKFLEMRLDNVVYRMGFAPSRKSARQIIRHGHIIVNGRKVDIPSFLLKANDEIKIKENRSQMPLIQEAMEASTEVDSIDWFKVDKPKFTGTVLNIPSREQIQLDVDERLIVEYYSK